MQSAGRTTNWGWKRRVSLVSFPGLCARGAFELDWVVGDECMAWLSYNGRNKFGRGEWGLECRWEEATL